MPITSLFRRNWHTQRDWWPPTLRFSRYTENQRAYYFPGSAILLGPYAAKWHQPSLWWRGVRVGRQVKKLGGVTDVTFAGQCLIVTRSGINSGLCTPFDKQVAGAILCGLKWPSLTLEDENRRYRGGVEVYPWPVLWRRLTHSAEFN